MKFRPSNPARRRFLRAASASVLAVASHRALAQAAGPAGGSARRMATEALRDGIALLTGAGGNVVVFRGPDGVAVVDSGAPAGAEETFATVLDMVDGAAVDVLFNTHWHPDHTGGNDPFGASGSKIVAHENTRLWMSTEYYVDWQDRTYEPRAPEALPTDTFYSHEPQPIAVDVGGEAIEYGHLREAHTDGDIYVWFRGPNVLVAGGAVASGAYPVLDYATGGWIGGLMDATEKLIGLVDDDTVIVPAHGPVRTRAHLQGQYTMLATVRERIENLMRQGRSAEEMLAAGVTDEFDAAWGENRERFVTNIYGGLWWQGRLQNSL